MTHNTSKTLTLLAGVALFAGAALPAFAQVGVSATADVMVGKNEDKTLRANVTAKGNASTTVIARGQTKANQEIDRRIVGLNKLTERINVMLRITSDQKEAIGASLKNQITALETLRAKIAADTDPAVLKVDVKSITDSYRIFALVIPQGQVIAAADRAENIADTIMALAVKYEARASAAKAAGADTTAVDALILNMKAKATDANVQAQAAVTIAANLVPDNGDQTVMAANKKALMDARAKLKLAHDDFVAARKDSVSILKTVKSWKVTTSTTASTTVSQ